MADTMDLWLPAKAPLQYLKEPLQNTRHPTTFRYSKHWIVSRKSYKMLRDFMFLINASEELPLDKSLILLHFNHRWDY
jgi:hypothetical protein